MTSVSVTSSVRTLRRKVVCPQVAGHPVDEADVGELTAGDVDGQPDVEARPSPLANLGAGLGEHEVGDLADEAHLLGDPDELVRRDDAVHGMVPAGQRLDLDDRRRT